MISREQMAAVGHDLGEVIQAEKDAAPAKSSLEIAYEKTRSAILKAELKPNDSISQVRLSKQLGVSRTPLREALRLLEREGLVESQHNKRVVISQVSETDLEDLYVLRMNVETFAIQTSVPRLSRSDLLKIRATLAEMDDLMAKEDVDNWEVRHREFHRLLVQHSGERTVRIIEELTDHAERYRRTFIAQGMQGWKTSARDHQQILEHCEKGDAMAASAALARHYARTSLSIFSMQAPHYEPSRIREALRLLEQKTEK